MTKEILRTTYKIKREQLSASQVEDFSLAIANQLLNLHLWDKSFYHVFLPIESQKEVNTEYILNILAGKDKHTVISKSHFEDASMSHYLLTDNTKIKNNSYGIPEPIDGIKIEPSQLEVIFVPLLAFDKIGHRIGYGKGFYDRFLSGCAPETIKIGLSFFEAEDHFDFEDTNDIRLDYCVTPKEIYQF